MPTDPIRGRGAADNPTGRFEPMVYEPDPDAPPEDQPSPETQFFRDTSRTLITYNDSPDIPFNASINPYRGCEHGCPYCLSGDTMILMADGGVRRLADVRSGDAIYGTRRKGWYRQFVKTRVEAKWQVVEPAYRVTLEDGTSLIAGANHRFLTERGWKHVIGTEQGPLQRPHLTVNNKLMGVGAFAKIPEQTDEYKRGYLCGMIRGDGLLGSYRYERKGGGSQQHQFRLALTDKEALERTTAYLHGFAVDTHRFIFKAAFANRRALSAIRTHSRPLVERVKEIIRFPTRGSLDWCKGFLAGIFDAEGSYSLGVWRMSNTDAGIIQQTVHCLNRFGFRHAIESKGPRGTRKKPIDVLRLCGGLREHLRFFHTVDPAITRKRNIEGISIKSACRLRVVSIEKLPHMQQMFDITTGTEDFIANGVVSHNCYARPTHEYFGLSAGLDFETKIFVKEDAPRLLRKELMSPKWKPQLVALSGVTDCYQPIERKLQLTRRCLEVLAEFRNPTGIVTKSALVTRDIDVLGGLAAHDATMVFLSITSLDNELIGKMEPRTSRPAARLAALQELSSAGIPVGVLVAPVIPGLTDHEMPAILDAAAKAGARYAGFGMLRLPFGLPTLFLNWLERHYPQKKDKVLSRIRALRGGKLNDSSFVTRMRGQGPIADAIKSMFQLACRQAGIVGRGMKLSTAAFRRPGEQRSLFD